MGVPQSSALGDVYAALSASRSNSSTTRPARTSSDVWLVRLVTTCLFLVAAVLLLGLALSKSLSHDEHQFVVSGSLLADRLLLPYRDYPYFHSPVLTLVYAGIFKVAGDHLLVARLFSVACALATLALLFGTALRNLAGLTSRRCPIVAVATILLLLASPLFTFTTGYAWNHDFSILLLVAAFLTILRGLEARPDWRLVATAGVLLGLSAGARLSAAPAAAPFLAAALFAPGAAGAKERIRLATAFTAGLAIGALPTLTFFALAPAQFLFGNFRYAQLNTEYRAQTSYLEAMSLGGKAEYLGGQVLSQPATLALVALFVAVAVPVLLSRCSTPTARFRVAAIAAMLPFLLAGALVPTPSFYQYFYVLVPFLVLGVVFGLSGLAAAGEIGKPVGALLGVAVMLACLSSLRDYGRPSRLLTGQVPEPVVAGEVGRALGDLVGSGPVLTLSPIYPMEGEARVYPAFATGPFAWRSAPLVDAEERAQFGLVAPNELERAVEDTPPVGVLVGLEGELDAPLVAYARGHGYQAFGMPGGLTLWVDCGRARCPVERR